ncbi:hypothetical protein TSUD_18640 [Trifolium subterraneum]|uniref:Uncharacterized protein n=1 Tax=Trifolium subterraneum TaxID=3900 RepID=A0A2Z6MCS0_TRISU|nr:hypothetical protein TSUD_18640 [Trifolium subterraneum]
MQMKAAKKQEQLILLIMQTKETESSEKPVEKKALCKRLWAFYRVYSNPGHEVGGMGQFGSAMHGGPNHPLFQGPAE